MSFGQNADQTASTRWLFRADASPTLGIGHVMRCLTLAAEANTRGWRCELLTKDLPDQLRARAEQYSIGVIDVDRVPGSIADVRAFQDMPAAVRVIDGYHLGAHFTESGPPSVSVRIDDNLEVPVAGSSIVVNQNPHAGALDYPHDPSQAFLLGLEYALVRPEIRAVRHLPRPDERVLPSVLVSMGGADPQELTGSLLDLLLRSGDMELHVALGPSNPRVEELRARIASAPSHASEVSQQEFARVLASSELAVLAAGSTLWEAAHLGVPVVGVVVAENQQQLAETAEVQRFARIHRGDGRTIGAIADDVMALLGDEQRRSEMSAAGHDLVDGLGSERVVGVIEQSLVERMRRR